MSNFSVLFLAFLLSAMVDFKAVRSFANLVKHLESGNKSNFHGSFLSNCFFQRPCTYNIIFEHFTYAYSCKVRVLFPQLQPLDRRAQPVSAHVCC